MRFDAAKEHFAILSTSEPWGEAFKVLGVLFDTKLQMGCAVRECVHEVGWKLRTLLRTRRYHSVIELVLLYKSHILSYVEYRTPGIYHAATSILEPIDRIQVRFLRDAGVSLLDALLEFNLAPLESRRDIAMLGVIHRAILRLGPDCFQQWFRPGVESWRSSRERRNTARPLAEILPIRSLDITRRSAFGLIFVYNMLPNDIVLADSVANFQKGLSDLMKAQARCGHPSWSTLFSPRCAYISHPLRHLS